MASDQNALDFGDRVTVEVRGHSRESALQVLDTVAQDEALRQLLTPSPVGAHPKEGEFGGVLAVVQPFIVEFAGGLSVVALEAAVRAALTRHRREKQKGTPPEEVGVSVTIRKLNRVVEISIKVDA
ncbi:MAG: hypothetical protein U0237_14790 [Thermoleophilia bacterium]